jgi:hypothetical protein
METKELEPEMLLPLLHNEWRSFLVRKRLERQFTESIKYRLQRDPVLRELLEKAYAEHRKKIMTEKMPPCVACGEPCATERSNFCPDCFKKGKKATEPYEYVDRPSHYDIPGTDLQAIDIIHALGYGHGFVMGNLLKLGVRCGRKPGESDLRDMKKTHWYLGDYIERLEKERDECSDS